jgi:hypothetical protein
MIKLYAGIGLAAVLALSVWRYNHISEELDAQRARATKAEEVVTQMTRNQELENWSREQYLKELEIAKNEKDRIENCIANRTCVATVRVRVPSVCPGGTEGDPAGTEEVTAQLSPAAERTRANLERRIREQEAALAMAMRTLEQWETK